jgi:hypothetical protein
MRTKSSLLLILLSMVLFSCFKEDEPIAPHPKGDLKTDTIPMTQNYKYQVYFDLVTGMPIAQNDRSIFDLGFECSDQGWKIILNTADFARVADLGVVPFGQKQDTIGKTWLFDKSDGNPDSLSIGRWFDVVDGDTLSNQHVYAIDRGLNADGILLGYTQVIFDSLAGGKYYFRFADMNGGSGTSTVVAKDSTLNYRWFSFNNGGATTDNEPPKLDYDLLFTQYTTMLYTDIGEPYPYLVTGVLLNRFRVLAGVDSLHEFTAVTLEDAKKVTLSNALDRIGYDWKYYSFETGAYTMRTHLVYILRSSSGIYYKLRFIGFYNTKGEKGYPVIEYQAL